MVATSPPPHPVEPSATLTLSPQRRGPPWTWRPGPRPPHACSEHRAPAPSDPPSAHSTGLPRPQAPRPGGRRSAGARRPRSTGPPLVQPAVGPQIESQTPRRPPPLPPPPTPPGGSCRPYPAPGARGLGQPRTRPTAPLPHPSSRDRVCPAPSGRSLSTRHSTLEAGLCRATEKGGPSVDPPLRIQGEEPLVLS